MIDIINGVLQIDKFEFLIPLNGYLSTFSTIRQFIGDA